MMSENLSPISPETHEYQSSKFLMFEPLVEVPQLHMSILSRLSQQRSSSATSCETMMSTSSYPTNLQLLPPPTTTTTFMKEASPKNMKIDDDAVIREKTRLRRERNRINARKTRQRKKERALIMQQSLEDLNTEVHYMKVMKRVREAHAFAPLDEIILPPISSSTLTTTTNTCTRGVFLPNNISQLCNPVQQQSFLPTHDTDNDPI